MELTIIEHNGVFYVESRQVAEMVDKRHADLMRDIENYNQILENAKLRSQDFFIESTYKTEGNNKTYPCYLLTKKGCDMVANKMTGEKGVLFTAAYIDKFYEMEKQLQKQIPNLTPTTRPHYRSRMINTAVKDAAATAKTIMKLFGVRDGVAQATAFKMVESAYGLDMTPIKKAIPAAKHEIGWLTPTEIAMRMGGKKASYINILLAELGFQQCEVCGKKKIWQLTDAGKNYGEAFPYDASSGHSGYQIKWNENILSLLQMREGATI